MVKRINNDSDLMAFDELYGEEFSGDVLAMCKRDVIMQARRLRAAGKVVTDNMLSCAIWGLYQYQSFAEKQQRLAA